MDTDDYEPDPEHVAFHIGNQSKHTDINVQVVHNGRTYWHKTRISYERVGPRFNMELQYQFARAWKNITRDIEYTEREAEATNPFAWSRGPI